MNKKQLLVPAAIIRDGDKFLLQLRNDPSVPEAHNKWEFPGGEIEYGESPQEALIRECREEIGCEIEIIQLIPQIPIRFWKLSDGSETQVFLLLYVCKIKNGTPNPSNDEVSEIRWLTKEEIAKLNSLPGTVEYINQI